MSTICLILDYNYLKEYDFVIVGSGPAGSVLANRLSENPNHTVLLIEAGKVETFMQNIPLFAAFMQSTAYSWDYLTEPQTKACLGINFDFYNNHNSAILQIFKE